MSILNVEHLSHGFGDRAIFHDVSFRLLKGEHIGLIGANGEGKSTFMNIITGKLQPDEGKVEWAKRVRVGYLDQHAVLEKGMTVREVLKNAFSFLFELEEQMNGICDRLGDAPEGEMEAMMEELGTIQDLLMAHDFYTIDAKVDEVGRALGLADIGMEKDVTELSGGQLGRSVANCFGECPVGYFRCRLLRLAHRQIFAWAAQRSGIHRRPHQYCGPVPVLLFRKRNVHQHIEHGVIRDDHRHTDLFPRRPDGHRHRASRSHRRNYRHRWPYQLYRCRHAGYHQRPSARCTQGDDRQRNPL